MTPCKTVGGPDWQDADVRKTLVETSLKAVNGSAEEATTTACCYLYVDDADELFKWWSKIDHGGKLHSPANTDYGLREFGFVDQDGNLIRVGSPL